MLYIYIHVFCLQLRKKRLERLSGLSPSQSPQSSQLTTPTTESKPDPEKSDGRDVNQEWVSQSQLISSQTEDLLRVEHDGILDSLEDKTSKVRTGDSQSMDTCSASQELVTVEQVQENSLSPFPSLQSGPGSLNRQQIHQPLKVTTTPLMGPAIPSPIILVEKVLRVKLLVSSHTGVIAGYTICAQFCYILKFCKWSQKTIILFSFFMFNYVRTYLHTNGMLMYSLHLIMLRQVRTYIRMYVYGHLYQVSMFFYCVYIRTYVRMA